MNTLKIGGLLIIIGIICIAISFVPLYAFLPANSYWEVRTSLSIGQIPHNEEQIGTLVWPSYVKLEVSVYGGNNQVYAQVYNRGSDNITSVFINGTGDIFFQVPSNSFYGLYVTNPPNIIQAAKQILIKVYYYYYDVIFLILGSLLIVLGVAISYYQWGKMKNKAATTPPS